MIRKTIKQIKMTCQKRILNKQTKVNLKWTAIKKINKQIFKYFWMQYNNWIMINWVKL